MRKVLILGIFGLSLVAGDKFVDSLVCKGCHPTIYKELQNSKHIKSSIYTGKLHKAIWDLHPKKAQGDYNCAKCHSPSDEELMKKIKVDGKAVPAKNYAQLKDPISCANCHSIKDIEEHSKTNSNIYTDKVKTYYSSKNEKIYKEESYFFGLFKKTSGSPFHNIEKNNNFATGKTCMGCHSHKKNSKDFMICSMDNVDYKAKNNCVTCHMPKVKGTATTIKITQKHSFHGFAGAHHRQDLMAKYLKLNLKKSDNGFEVSLKNEANHQLFLHTLRVAILKVTIKRGNDEIKLKPKKFMKIIGDEGKPAFPWAASTVLKDTMLQAGENRIIKYDDKLQSGDMVNIEFGYYLVNPKVVKKLSLEGDEVTKYKILKSKNIFIK